MSRILIIEDEPRLAAFLEKGLGADGFTTTVAATGAQGVAIASDDDFDLMILDLGLPDVDGLDVLREIRVRGSHMPVIILTARDDTADMVASLDLGADDYVSKPFRFEELLARIRLRLRTGGTAGEDVLRAGAVSLDIRSRRAQVGDREIVLTAREYKMLEALMHHAGQVMTREQLLSHVWGYDHDPGSNVVDVYIGYLRRKLGEGTITTVRGMGYRLEP